MNYNEWTDQRGYLTLKKSFIFWFWLDTLRGWTHQAWTDQRGSFACIKIGKNSGERKKWTYTGVDRLESGQIERFHNG